MATAPVVTLLTDFGTTDGYAGVMKGVILRGNPQARVVDLSHEIPPHEVERAALLLGDVLRFFPKETVHLVVVDPGVGTSRRGLAVESEEGLGVGPDNGVLTPLLQEAKMVVELKEERFFLTPVSRTFHGRDVFAPVAAAISRGIDIGQFGPRVDDAYQLRLPAAIREADRIVGEILYADRFGNLVTSVVPDDVEGWEVPLIDIAGSKIEGISANYHDGDRYLRALWGSNGRLEIACREGSAASFLGAGPGERVILKRGADERRRAGSGR